MAIDAEAGPRGSVVFRVFIDDGSGTWQERATSEIVRGGEPPVPISVDLTGAKRISLLVDYRRPRRRAGPRRLAQCAAGALATSALCEAAFTPRTCPSRPALASASGIRYLASNWPRPPRMASLSPNAVQPSVRQTSDTSSVGTGCQLWLFSRLGVLWSPVTISTVGFERRDPRHRRRRALRSA